MRAAEQTTCSRLCRLILAVTQIDLNKWMEIQFPLEEKPAEMTITNLQRQDIADTITL